VAALEHVRLGDAEVELRGLRVLGHQRGEVLAELVALADRLARLGRADAAARHEQRDEQGRNQELVVVGHGVLGVPVRSRRATRRAARSRIMPESGRLPIVGSRRLV
jgi:hypothetical protein